MRKHARKQHASWLAFLDSEHRARTRTNGYAGADAYASPCTDPLRGEFEPIFEDVEVGAAPADEDEEPARPLIRRLSSTGEVLLVETGGSRVSRAGHVLSMDDQLSDDGDRLAH